MKKFIRLDKKGHWRGTEHRSSFQGMAEYWDNDDNVKSAWEDGVSCYQLDDVASAIDQLRWYWYENAMMKSSSEYADMQVTIFIGTRVGEGSDYEDLAECEETLLETDAEPFMKKIIEVYELYKYEEEIEEDEYNEKLVSIFGELVQ